MLNRTRFLVFESAYKPRLLRNWEVPKLKCDKPQRRTGKTRFVANDRGHLLPIVDKSNLRPWRNYLGTWDLPKKIDRKTADELSGLVKTRNIDKVICSQKSARNKDKTCEDNEETNKENIDNSLRNPQTYVPGDLTEEHHRLPSHEELATNRFTAEKSPRRGLPSIRDDFSRPLPEPDKDLSKEVDDFLESQKEMVHAAYPKKSPDSKKERLLSPILAAISNFSLAKKLHKENLEHKPLPDTVSDTMYRKMQMQERSGEPGLVLEDKHFATGVGWKGYPGYGPTRCTKLKVYRPKTCGNTKEDSISSFDRKWRFIRQSKVTPIDLAICWDLTPEDPKDEPKSTAHIDGSNGSAAPAVFSLVHTPKEEEVTQKCDGIHGCGPLFAHSHNGNEEKEYIFHRSIKKPSSVNSNKSDESSGKKRAKSAHDTDKQSEHSKHSSGSSTHSRAKSAYNLNESQHCLSSKESNNNNICNKIHQSTPNLSEQKCNKKSPNNRLCVACELKNMSMKEKRPKSEYKMAFKGGVPQKIKARRQDYPEHWRLATVYQHSYKPIQFRKRPMLHTVFK